jgi:hypothetical protein
MLLQNIAIITHIYHINSVIPAQAAPPAAGHRGAGKKD